ncbi:MAG: TolB family protein, partial [Gammaproteobacteria bacterium]
VNARVGELVVHPVDQSLYGIRIENGSAALVRLPPPYDTWFRIHEFPDGTVPGDLDISPDGRLLSASVSEVGGRQFLRIWSLDQLQNGDLTPLSQFDFGQALPESFVFSPDGRFLYGSSYYTGVSNIFRYEVATGAIEAVTNAETGYFRPVPLKDGRLLALTYGAEGFTPVMLDPQPLQDVSAIRFLGAELVERHPQLLTWQVPPPGTADVAGLTTPRGPYHPARRMALLNAYPVLQGYKDQIGPGYRLNFNDPENFASASLTAAWTPGGDLSGGEQAHVDLSGRYLFWRGSVSWNRSDFYDLFGPTERSRKGLAIKLGHERRLIDDEPRLLRLTWDLAHYDDIDTLPGAQKVGTDFTRLTTAEVGLRYTDLKRSLGAIDDERGVTGSLVAYGSAANSAWVPQWLGTLDVGRPLPLPNSSIWLRSAAGAGYGDPDDPLANFYFGGFGNNWVDNGLVPRYRNFDALPGFEINERQGLRFLREMVEVNLPPVFFESVGRPDFHLSSVRPALFAAGLWTDPDRGAREARLGSIGLQADLGFRILHWYDMTLSAGFAWGFEGREFAGTEFMLSLKLL